MTKKQKDDLKFSERLGDAINRLYINGLLTNAERAKVERRYVAWAKSRGVTVTKKPIFG